MERLYRAVDTPERDIAAVLRAQAVFWLLGATDGHAKNFSVFLRPGGGFELTPLYDVMSTQPLRDAHQISRNDMKPAMSVGKNRHYVVSAIQPRHFAQTAQSARLPTEIIETIFVDLIERAANAVAEVTAQLPAGFPEQIRDSVIAGLEKRLRLIEAGRF